MWLQIQKMPVALLLLMFAASLTCSACDNTSREFGQDYVVQKETIASGTFAGMDGHSAEGDVQLFKSASTYYLKFLDDFTIEDGPDLYVYMGKNGNYSPGTLISTLGQNSGSRTYEIPSSISIQQYSEVWIWSRLQDTAYARALLK